MQYKCRVCDYKSAFKGNTKRHFESIHLAIKKFHCKECNFKSYIKNAVDRHNISVHLNIKNYACNMCDYKSSTKCHLRRHIKTCTGKSNKSSGEFKVMKALEDLGFEEDVDYLYNQSLKGLTVHCGKSLRPDFRFLKHKIIIEYDGYQHTNIVRFGGISEERAEKTFELTKLNDKLKDEFCLEMGWKMIRISYEESANILSILSVELYDIVDWDN